MTISGFVPRYCLGRTAEHNALVSKTPFHTENLPEDIRSNLIAMAFERCQQLEGAAMNVAEALQVSYGYLVQLGKGLRSTETMPATLVLALSGYLRLPFAEVLHRAYPLLAESEVRAMVHLVRAAQKNEGEVEIHLAALGFTRSPPRTEWFTFTRQTDAGLLKVGCYLDASQYGPMAELLVDPAEAPNGLCLAEKYSHPGDWDKFFLVAVKLVVYKATKAEVPAFAFA